MWAWLFDIDTPNQNRTHNFGNVSFSRNSNMKVSGTNNKGHVSSNANLQLYTSNCVLDLKSNANAKVQAEDSTLEVQSCANVNISGTGNKVVLKRNPNAILQGNDNNVEATSNSNLSVIAKESILKLFDNANMKVVDLESGNVFAERNANLRILGTTGIARVSDTKNHELRSIQNADGSRDSDGMNRFELGPSSTSASTTTIISDDSGVTINGVNLGSFISNVFSSNGSIFTDGGGRVFTSSSCNCKVMVDYLGKAVIEGNKYKVGIFDFHLVTTLESQGKYELKLDAAGFDVDALEVNEVGPGEIMVKGTKDGDTQKLKIRAPKITQKDPSATQLIFEMDVTA